MQQSRLSWKGEIMKNSNQTMRVCVAAVLATFTGTAVASGLAIGTQSGSGTGNAFAGGAASAEDASTVWYNPAGMTALPGKTNFSIAAHALRPSFKFQNTASTLPVGTGEGGDGGSWAHIPQAFVTTKLTDKWSVGAAFNTPFGLKTEFDAGWRGQIIGLKSELKTYNLNASAAYKFSDTVSVGGGLNYQRAELEFSSILSAPFAGFVTGPSLSDNGFGYNAGVLFQLQPQTRLGAHYRSAINFQATGSHIAPAALGGNGAATAGLTTPDSFSISVFHALSQRWDLMADVTWTGWSHVKRLSVVRTSGPASGALASAITFNWRDTWRTSVGANYKPNDAWKFRFGIAYDQTPANDVDRTARLPDQDRTWIAVGVQTKLSKAGTLDFGYAHEFIKDPTVSNASPLGGTLVGKFSAKADILSVQYSHLF